MVRIEEESIGVTTFLKGGGTRQDGVLNVFIYIDVHVYLYIYVNKYVYIHILYIYI